jgi:hypothetical protein
MLEAVEINAPGKIDLKLFEKRLKDWYRINNQNPFNQIFWDSS